MLLGCRTSQLSGTQMHYLGKTQKRPLFVSKKNAGMEAVEEVPQRLGWVCIHMQMCLALHAPMISVLWATALAMATAQRLANWSNPDIACNCTFQ
jgi:hypothetical protein